MQDHRMVDPVATLRISEDVFKKIAEIAALEVEGVLAISTRMPNFKESFLSIKTRIKEIDIKTSHDVMEVSISIIVDSTSRVVSVSKKVQKQIKQAIQNMTSIPVSNVFVEVANMAYVVDSNGDLKEGFVKTKDENQNEKLLYLRDFELNETPDKT